MASTTIRDNIAIGEPNILVAVSPTSDGSSQNQYSVSNVGALTTSGDGRNFRFAYDGGTALVAGSLLQSTPQSTTNLQSLTLGTVAVGDTTVSVTSTASTLAANALNGGYLTMTTGAGAGQTYAISGNTSAATSAFTITLADPIRVAATTPAAAATYNPYYGVVVMPTTVTGAPIGAAIIPTAGTQYAWIQTKGVIALQNDGGSTIAVGQPVVASTVTAGTISGTTTGLFVIGTTLEAIAGTKWGLVQLELG